MASSCGWSRLGRDADVGLAADEHLRDLLRRALVQRQRHLRVQRAEVLHHRRQRVARLRVRGRDRQRPAVHRRELGAHAAQVVGVQQQAFDDRQHRLARRRQAREALAHALENLHAQLVFQLADLAADARLARVQHRRHLGEVEARAGGLADGLQLLEVHGGGGKAGRKPAIVTVRRAWP
jgi:hypothetical protein